MDLTLYGYEGNPRTKIIRIAVKFPLQSRQIKDQKLTSHQAALEGIPLHLSIVVPRMYINTEDYLAEFPLSRTKVPALKGPDIQITEVIAIAMYISRIHNRANLLGDGSNKQMAEVISWVSWANQEMLSTLASWFLPLVPGLKKPAPYNQEAVAGGKVATDDLMAKLEDALSSKSYLVGGSVTLADLFLAMYLARGMEYVLDTEWRSNHPNIMKYFDGITQIPQWKAVVPSMKMIDVETPNKDPYGTL
ncbi:hypothetical protein N7456_012291 [Penicillium angulare]|uniref:Glutathione S-transferase n=1 Tax=Penicillium angulare TaxID=116970 RepID=A0A9W9EVJ5_9EURO|nr:hypothetical protein N7456_012291 [Penicillium angulare]